ncbi:hypothetical protein BTHI11S_05812 [Bosea thiooxidans]
MTDLPLRGLLIGPARPLGPRGVPSGIAKSRVSGAVALSETGFQGDVQGDPVRHGGPEKAVHHYPFEHYACWARELGPHPLLAAPGAFGENIATIGLTEEDVAIGDVFELGTAIVEVSQGRQPCWKLNERFGRASMARDARGRFLATRFTGVGNMGGYLSPVGPMMATLNIGKNSVGMYRTPLVEVQTRCAVTNTVPIAAYRGAGRPEGNYFMERLIDTAAREMGLDPAALRRRNLIGAAQLPWTTPIGTLYDSGDFPALFARALEAADWKGYGARLRRSRKAGKLRGRGIGCYLEVTAPPSNEMGGIHFEPDGGVTIVTGTLDYGQGHWTPFAQVLTSRLGVPFDKIRLVQGDSDRLIAGGGTGGSKSIMASGSAIIEASEKVVEKGKLLAAHFLEAAAADIEFAAGRFHIAGTDRSIGIMELAGRLRTAAGLPEDLPKTLDVDHVFKAAPSAYPNGCHVAEVEIDPETGEIAVVSYVMVNDFGTLVNPMIVEGQLHGGVVQGIGQAICEMTFYDEDGQLRTGSYMDYAMPRAAGLPSFTFISQGVPTSTNKVGAKGCGEAGCAGSLPSVMNAVVDALSPCGVRHVDMPATPQAIWKMIQAER